jgi:hypothetical protein
VVFGRGVSGFAAELTLVNDVDLNAHEVFLRGKRGCVEREALKAEVGDGNAWGQAAPLLVLA